MTKKILSSDITPESLYLNRRNIIKASGLIAGSAAVSPVAHAGIFGLFADEVVVPEQAVYQPKPLTIAKKVANNLTEVLTPESKVTSHNNFYEFGTNKTDPIENSKAFNPEPWSITIDGEVEKPRTFSMDDILKNHPIEERIYRLRCVEAWSMVIPWLGFSLADLIKKVNPTSKAKYVAFQTLYDPKQMPGQASRLGGGIPFPYVEGLTIAEAMHPLSLLSVGLYGKTLPAQNGAPIRLVVPWKYGFKSIKSIVKITLTEKEPPTTWQALAPNEYGFFANVNPQVDHPRWSQATERRIADGFRAERIDTLMFNGYGDEVASLYKGMDLRKFY
ncbi:protein-methionine-sulfoxide reductase catalytic subunit MsrP [Motilimonas sp. E26]|uniref:protein-methionine-sulfoxide reductase catalytic subunit MsrP n=1 Tax=Motilimonas sp. E26 TaxID=2865674 RepID=UPI001E33E8C5|nr:protein-methionine-sulfoxide reductase catalytic subunit MsrP [Motilimonas sp. E26]MCE0558152.1 protein-methionine-sulfoxide reductase catalytic subunit MsrP [Motilimonas sp. E26]